MNEHEATLQAIKMARQENKVIYVCVTAMVLGLYAMGAGGDCFWGLILLLFVKIGSGSKKQ